MDVRTIIQDQRFVWDSDKASVNLKKPRMSSSIPGFAMRMRASRRKRGMRPSGKMVRKGHCLWFTCCVKTIAFGLFLREKQGEGNGDDMRTMSERIRGRLRKDRPMATISIRIPEDLIGDLKEMAPVLGFGGYQPLIRSYIGEGMRRDEAKLAQTEVTVTQEILERHGIPQDVIEEVMSATLRKRA